MEMVLGGMIYRVQNTKVNSNFHIQSFIKPAYFTYFAPN